MWSDIAKRFKWWSDKGGDHHYTKQISRLCKLSWHDIVIARACVGKGHGRREDIREVQVEKLSPDTEVWCKYIKRIGSPTSMLKQMALSRAEVLEEEGIARITYQGVRTYGRIDKEDRKIG